MTTIPMRSAVRVTGLHPLHRLHLAAQFHCNLDYEVQRTRDPATGEHDGYVIHVPTAILAMWVQREADALMRGDVMPCEEAL